MLVSKNGEVVGQSRMCAHLSSAYTGIKSVIANAPDAEAVTAEAYRNDALLDPGRSVCSLMVLSH